MNNSTSIQKKKAKRSIYYFLGSLIVALILTFLLKEPTFTDSQVYAVFLLFFAVALWITEAIPPFAVSLFIFAYLVFTFGNPNINSAPEKIDKYVNTFSSSVIWLLLGGFFMATAMRKTGLDTRLLSLTLKISGSKPRNILIALMFTTMVAAMIMSDSAATSMVVAAITPLLVSLGKSGINKALLLGVAIAAAAGGMGTILTSTNAIAAGLVEETGRKVYFLDWMIYGVPISLSITAICCYILIRKYIRDSPPLSLDFLKPDSTQPITENAGQRTIVLIIMIVTILFWVTGSIHGIKAASISAIPIVGLTVTGVLTANDMKTLPWDTLFLVAGGLSLGEALKSTGVLNEYAVHLKTLNAHPIIFLLILAYLGMIAANVMSGIASCMLLIPLGMAILPGYRAEVAISVGLSVSCTLFLPVSIPSNVIVYSTGLLEQKDFRLGGTIAGLLGPLLAVLWTLLIHLKT